MMLTKLILLPDYRFLKNEWTSNQFTIPCKDFIQSYKHNQNEHYLNREIEKEKPHVSFDFRLRIERNYTFLQIREQEKDIVNDLKSIQIESGIHIRRVTSRNSTTLRTHKSKSSSPVADRNAKGIVIEREEIVVVNPNRGRERKVKDDNRQQTDLDAIEFQSNETERRIGGEKKETNGGEEEEGGGVEGTEAEKAPATVSRGTIQG